MAISNTLIPGSYIPGKPSPGIPGSFIPPPKQPPLTNSSLGLFGGGSTPQSTPATSYTAKPLFPTPQASSSLIQAPKALQSTEQPQYNAAQSYTPSNYNPNANAQITGLGDSSVQPSQSTQPVQGLFPSVASSLANFNPYNNPQVSDAYKKAQDINAQLAESRKNQANAEAENRLNPIPIGDQTGREAVMRNQYLAQQNALSSQLAGQSTLFNAGLTGTGQTLSGLNTAGSLTQPQLSQVGTQAYYNPLTGEQIGGSSANTPFGGGVAQGNVALGQQYAANVSANNQAKAVKGQINSYLESNPTLNPSEFSDVNKVIQLLSGRVSDPRYQVLSNLLTEYVNTLAPILGVGGDTTNLKTQIAQGFINAHQSGQSISSVLDGIEQLAQAKLSAQQGGSQGGNQSQVPTGSSLFSW